MKLQRYNLNLDYYHPEDVEQLESRVEELKQLNAEMLGVIKDIHLFFVNSPFRSNSESRLKSIIEKAEVMK